MCVSLNQNYASLSYLDIIVKASLKLDSPAKNMILRNADTQVRYIHLATSRSILLTISLNYFSW